VQGMHGHRGGWQECPSYQLPVLSTVDWQL